MAPTSTAASTQSRAASPGPRKAEKPAPESSKVKESQPGDAPAGEPEKSANSSAAKQGAPKQEAPQGWKARIARKPVLLMLGAGLVLLLPAVMLLPVKAPTSLEHLRPWLDEARAVLEAVPRWAAALAVAAVPAVLEGASRCRARRAAAPQGQEAKEKKAA